MVHRNSGRKTICNTKGFYVFIGLEKMHSFRTAYPKLSKKLNLKIVKLAVKEATRFRC